MTSDPYEPLLELARRVLENRLLGTDHDLSVYHREAFQRIGGVFITLTKAGKLRGCIGRIESDETLYQNVIDLVQAAAFDDHRFSKVTADELPEIRIEISLLSAPKAVNGASTVEKVMKIRPAVDGVVIEAEGKRATFLPQVWESIPVREGFFGELCRKAGLDPDYWQHHEMNISAYQAEKYQEKPLKRSIRRR
jgi:uncharacterized protein